MTHAERGAVDTPAPPARAANEAGAATARRTPAIAAEFQHVRQAGEPFDELLHCGAKSKRTGLPCRQYRGLRTKHPGQGRCWLHGGNTPSGAAFAERQAAEATLHELAIPVEGDPLEVLQRAVEAAHGVLLGAARLLKRGGSEVALRVYVDAIRDAARVAKQAAEAVNLDDLVRIRERESQILEQALLAGLDAVGVSDPARRSSALAATREVIAAALSREALN